MAAGPAPVPQAQAAQSWTSGAKDLVMTALGTSRVWATAGQGILNEIYWPAVDQPQVKDFGFLIGGAGWWQEVKRVGNYTLSTPGGGLMLPTMNNAATTAASTSTTAATGPSRGRRRLRSRSRPSGVIGRRS